MKYLSILLVLVPIVLVMEWLGVGGHSTMFVLSALSLIPLAAVLGNATENVATYTGPKIGGLLNATLGNAAELIITIVALREGLVTVVKASITGSIIGNVLLVLGAAAFFGGLKHGVQKFDTQVASVNASIMALAVMAMMIPAIFALGNEQHRPTDQEIVRLSDGTAIVLIILYAAYLAGTIFLTGGSKFSVARSSETSAETEKAGMSLPMAIGVLVVATLAIVAMSEILVGALEPTADAWGLSDLFVGVILVPVVGNIAEHIVAVQVALKNKMELSIGIAIGSAVQIALFVAPVLVLVSQFVGPSPITLVFNQFELVALFAAILITVMISIDGRSNWLEGLQLTALYVIIALAFFFMP
ncbi:MAG TPA: calcium/proton exchanger [Thermomicrobiales bacterium]|nr:calcium/proton exchanger [Thermomicrobiales bacterium]